MITPRDVQPLVATPEFQRVIAIAAAEPESRAYRLLKGLERIARGTTRDAERDASRGYGQTQFKASGGHAPRRSLKETVDGSSEHLSV